MGRTRRLAPNTDDGNNSTDDDRESSMDDFVADFGPLHVSPRTHRTNPEPIASSTPPQAGPSGVSTVNSRIPRLIASVGRRRRLVVETPRRNSNTNTNSNSNSPRQPSPKLPRLEAAESRPEQGADRLDESFWRNYLNRRGRSLFDSSDEDVGATMNAGSPAAGGDEDDSPRESRLRRRPRFSQSTTTGRRPTATATASDRRTRQQQLEADEAYARRLQAQFDAQYHAEQQQRRRREAAVARRQNRNQANSYRPPTPPLPSRMQDYSESLDEDDDDQDPMIPIELANILFDHADGTSRESAPRGRHGPRGGSPSGPTTLASVRRYFREAHMDATLFPDAGISILGFEALLELADQLGETMPSMSASEINRLPTSVYRQLNNCGDQAETSSSTSGSSSNTNYSDDTPLCAICMELFNDGDVQRNLPCFHAFHKDCVDVWLKQKSSCPVCRVDARQTSPNVSP